MVRPFGSEQGNFSLFILLVLLSAYLFTLPQASFWVSGGVMMIWGAFGFWRLAVISFYEGRSTKLAALPARLMATLDERDHKLRQHGYNRLHHLDIQLWFAAGCAYAVIVALTFLIPAPVQAVVDLQLSMNDFWQELGGQGPEVRLGGNADALVRQLAFLFCMGVAAFTVHSFSYSENFIRQAGLVILPVFLVMAVIAAVLPVAAPVVPVPGDMPWRGAGAGAVSVVEAMNTQAPLSHSFFARRVIEQGFVGADLLYLLYLLPGAALVRYMARSGRKAVGLSALAVMGVMAWLDIMLPAGGMVAGILFMGTAYVALAWGHSAYLRPYWALKIADQPQA